MSELATEAAQAVVEEVTDAIVREHVVVCLSGLSAHENGSPIFGCKVYGPYSPSEADEKAREIQWIEGGAVLIRPLVDLADTYRRLSAD